MGVQQDMVNMIATLGRGVASSLYPKDFEIYLMGLELTDSEDNTIDYFAFPIMPESITKVEPKSTNIKASNSGIVYLSSNSFLPEEITIKGNFGRMFKFYLSPKEPSVEGFAFSMLKGKFDLLSTRDDFGFGVKSLNVGVKTGYGAHSLLRAIINKSNGVDSKGKPFKLYFYNMALGESYLVAIPNQGFTSSQNREKNMIWDYSFTMNVLAPLSALKSMKIRNSLSALLSFASMQQAVNATASLAKTVANG